MFVAAVAVLLLFNYWLRRNDWRVIGLSVLAMAMCPLLAARFESDVAVASALRWISAGFFAAGSVALWFLQSSGAARCSGAFRPNASGEDHALVWPATPSANTVRDLWVAFVVLIYVLIGAFVAQALFALAPQATTYDLHWWALAWALVAGFAALSIPFAFNSNWHQMDANALKAAKLWGVQAQRVLLLLAVAPAVVLFTFAIARVLATPPARRTGTRYLVSTHRNRRVVWRATCRNRSYVHRLRVP